MAIYFQFSQRPQNSKKITVLIAVFLLLFPAALFSCCTLAQNLKYVYQTPALADNDPQAVTASNIVFNSVTGTLAVAGSISCITSFLIILIACEKIGNSSIICWSKTLHFLIILCMVFNFGSCLFCGFMSNYYDKLYYWDPTITDSLYVQLQYAWKGYNSSSIAAAVFSGVSLALFIVLSCGLLSRHIEVEVNTISVQTRRDSKYNAQMQKLTV